MTGALLLAVAAALLVGGAELFAEHAAAAARHWRVSLLAVGLLLAGAEPEEAFTAVTAALRERPDLAAGDALGANVTMLTAALGLAALASPLPVGSRVRRYAAGAAAAGGLALAVLADGSASRPEGAVLLLAYAGLVAAVWRLEHAPPAVGELAELAEKHSPTGPSGGVGDGGLRDAALVLLGLLLMLAGGAVAVEGAVGVVGATGLDDTAVGLTALALATTAELFALVFAAARRGVSELAVAGVVGSVAYNATVTLGAAAVARPLRVDGMLAPAVLGAVLPLVVVGLGRGGALSRAAGGLLVSGYVGYVAWALSR